MKDWNSLTHDRYYEDHQSNNQVGIGILNISRDIKNEFVSKRCLEMTYFYINRMMKMKVADYVGSWHKVENILENSLAKGHEYCIVAAQGLLLYRGPNLVEQSLKYAKENPNFFVCGHIMDKKGQNHYATKGAYPGLHRQYLFVNLKVWEQLGKPPFDELGIFRDRMPKLQNFKLSEEKIHAEYTPAWIDTAEGEKHWAKTSDGSNWIDIALRSNIKIDNLTNDMRACKVFLYPYNKSDILSKSWIQKDYWQVEELNYNQKAWLRKLDQQEKIEKDRVYAFNTETLSGEGKRTENIDHLFSVAAGFKPLSILHTNGFNDNTKIHYFDWCDASLLYKRELIETWIGVDLHMWLLEHDLKYNFASTYRGNYEPFWQQELQDFGGAEAFKKLWDRYVNLEHNYYKIDIVNEPTNLFNIVKAQEGNKVLWTTNVWSSEMLHWNQGPDQLKIKWNKFKSLVPDDLILYGDDYCAIDMRQSIRDNLNISYPEFN